jgi:release factor glutamine methyltransferase
MTPQTIREAFAEASSFFRRNNIQQDPDRVSEWLLCHLLGWDRSRLFAHWHDPFPAEKTKEWEAMLQRKAEGEPVQYIVGVQEFYGLSFKVNPAVLIPRPETEILVEQILALGQGHWPGERLVLADIGTGSGAIAVTIAAHCPAWEVIATDISAEALAVARENAAVHGVAARIRWMQGDLLQPLIAARQPVDILVSNPPYIPTGDLAALPAEVGRHEPLTALDGGADGLRFYRRLAEQMSTLPRRPRLIGVETGAGQAREVAEMLAAGNHWRRIQIVRDLAGIERHVIACEN